MALSGNWKQSRAVEAPALNNLGRGWNPVHAIHDAEGRNIAPNNGSSLADVVPTDYTVDPMLDDPAGSDSQFAYDAYDDEIWGYGVDDGTADRPPWGTTTEQMGTRARSDIPAPNWPEWGPYSNGLPGGTIIRDENRGASLTKRVKQRKLETVSEGWENKRYEEEPLDAEQSDPSQLFMQTSMTQRDKVRDGSQAAQGRENEPRASIGSRIVGMRLKIWSGGERHYDMTPRIAEERIRPWWTRQAGTGNADNMTANEMTVRTPITRQVPAEPDQGQTVPLVDHSSYGYVSEDVIPYA